MEIFYFIAILMAVCAEPPVPEGFAGYERGGYEIQTGDQKTFPGADQLNFPGVSDLTGGPAIGGGGSRSTDGFPQSGGRPGSVGSVVGSQSSAELRQDEFSSGRRNDLGGSGGRGERQRGSGRFEGGSEGDEEGGEGSLDDIPGVPGKDYPIYGEIPTTSFSCDQQTAPGYYADVETQCQVFHICQKGGQKNSVLCPNGTIFNQKVFVCSWWYDFDCDSAPGLFSLNEQNSAEADAASTRGGQGGGRAGGYTANGPDGRANLITSGAYTDDSQNFDRGNTDLSENGINGGASLAGDQNAFGGYQENGPRPAKLTGFTRDEQNGGVPESQNALSRRGSGRFSAIGQNRGDNKGKFEGYSENGPNERSRNDLTTSGGFSGGNGGDSLSGYSSGRVGSSGSVEQVNEVAGGGYPRGRNGRNGNGNAQGSGSRYDGSAGNDELEALRDQSGQNGYSSGGVDGGGLEQSNQYLPPGDGATGIQNGIGGFNNGITLTTDRSYLPPS